MLFVKPPSKLLSDPIASPPRMRKSAGAAICLLAGFATAAVACGPASDARSGGVSSVTDKWAERSRQSFRIGDFEDAHESAASALHTAPNDPVLRILSARVALTKLEFTEALTLTEGLTTTEAHSIRGRAFWFSGDIEQAADELEAMLKDPAVKDPWARAIARLARRGTGRRPFTMEGGMVAAVEMPRAGPFLIVPCELEGENVLALVATSSSEVVIDSNTRKEPAWINLRFGDHVEVKDVPALTQDLSGISRQLGASIRALLGIDLLRHLHVTFDRRGDQFVVRRNEATPPPNASRVPLWYVRGSGMLLRASVTPQGDPKSLFLVDSSAAYPVALEDATWKIAGLDPATLKSEPEAPGNIKSGTLPMFKLGGFDLPQIPAFQGAMTTDVRAAVDSDLGGIVGAGLLSLFRVTFADNGRFAWLEADPNLETANRDAKPPSPTETKP